MNGVCFLGLDKQTGSTEPGKAADLVLLKGNPVQRIGDIENALVVFKDGGACRRYTIQSRAYGRLVAVRP